MGAPPAPVRAWIGLGSNLAGELDSPRAQLEQAIAALAALPRSRLTVVSPAFATPALRAPGDGQPQPDYLNAVAGLDTSLTPLDLLDALQAIEQSQGRVRERRWGPRTLDLDLLLYGDAVIDTPRLCVPHPGLAERAFVLVPLATVAPDLRLPDGRAIAALLAQCPGTDAVRRAGILA